MDEGMTTDGAVIRLGVQRRGSTGLVTVKGDSYQPPR
jgi:hypothetical protein